jgi:quercetin dioxygenase-like cupin family protein
MRNRAMRVVVMAFVLALAACAPRTQKAAPSPEPVKASGMAVAVPEDAAPVAHAMIAPDAIKWQPFPPGGPGSTFAVLAGDTEKPGPFVLRIKSPAGGKIPPHWHPTDEHVTVIKGTLALGMGEEFDARALRRLPPGSYALLPRKMRHFAQSKTETIVQVHGTGPFEIIFVNPADDPRKKASKQ